MKKIIGALAIIGLGILAYNEYKKAKAAKKKVTISEK